MEWLREALCKGKNQDFWYPPLEEGNHTAYYRIGKSLCYKCPVWEDCLTYAKKKDEVWGCWGGLTPQERNKPDKVIHPSMESYRAGCRCLDCVGASKATYPQLPDQAFPVAHEPYDINDLIFKLHQR
jgi:WhiB family redox-sensing transcriptional regulator